MDAKMIEMNNLRVLNDYLNQTLDVLVRQPRVGQSATPAFGFSPFAPLPTPAGTMGTDTVYGPWHPSMPQHASFGPGSLPTFPVYGAGYGSVDPFVAQRTFGQGIYGQPFAPYGQPIGFGPSTFGPSTFGWQPQGWQSQGWQPSWSPISEAQRQAHVNHTLAAKQSVLEAMCRAMGIPV
jgi:hypothetical protein